MTQQKHLPEILLYSTLAAAAAAGVLLPRGEGWAHLIFLGTLGLATAAVAGFAYARGVRAPTLRQDAALRPDIDWVMAESALVPQSLLEGAAPLVAVVGEGEVPHPEFAATLAPYFADPNVAFVQGAARYEGTAGVAEAYRQLSTLSDEAEAARANLGAVLLRGSGALVSREAAREAYRPGDTWQSLGLRMVAAGYAGRFERQAMVLAWAPLTFGQYGAALARSTRTALDLIRVSLTARGLSGELRLQYLSAAAAPLAVWAAAACGAATTAALVLRGAGPVILTSPAALPMAVLSALCVGAAAWAWMALTRRNPARPLALAFAGAYVYVYQTLYAAATGPRARRMRGTLVELGRRTLATVRANGSAGTAPAGTPARS